MRKALAVLSILDLLYLQLGWVPAEAAVRAQGGGVAEVIEQFREDIPKIMAQGKIPGMAIVVVDDQSVLWVEGFGYTDTDRRTPVTPDTPFSIQSVSKSFTATGVMFAVQNGLVDLNAPIATYLPGFQINSLFDAAPLEKISLLNLLSHTAGLALEAPVGGNFTAGRSFEEHIQSIQNTWLKFPAGQRYDYANMDVDLAGYILQTCSRVPFTRYIQKTIYEPLGMKNSGLATPEMRQVKNRAIGHTGLPFHPSTDFLILPSGGVYASARDMARYLLFHINGGVIDGQRLLREDLLATMYTPPNSAALREGYALGVTVSQHNGARMIEHGGGGFGFLSEMVFYPELKLGLVMLTNSATHHVQKSLPQSILDAIIASQPEVYAQRTAVNRPALPVFPTNLTSPTLSDSALEALIQQRALPVDEAARIRAQRNAGYYLWLGFGLPNNLMELKMVTGQLHSADSALYEIQPNFYLDRRGDVYDLCGPRIHYRQIPLFKINLWLAWGLPILIGLATWLAVLTRRRRKGFKKISGFLSP